ncbi:MAG: PQQ-binding-like beta-propeller repeat protein [Pirellulales bacterium]
MNSPINLRTAIRFLAGCSLVAALLASGWMMLDLSAEAAAPAKGKKVSQKKTAGQADWPQWRGPNRDGISPSTGLLTAWPKDGPKLLWTCRDLGRGFASCAVVGDRLYTLGSDGKTAQVIAVNTQNGKAVWTADLGAQFENNWGGGPRGTPTVDGDFVYALDAVGTLACLERTSGQKIWSRSLVDDFGGRVPNWGYCESPLVDGNKVLATPGGKNCIVALDKKTGEKIWFSQGDGQDQFNEGAHYASLVKGSVGGKDIYTTQTSRGIVGVAADDGRLQFRFDKTGNGTATIPTPIFHNEYIYGTSGYGTGCGLVKLSAGGQGVTAEEVYFNKEMKNQHGGVILVGDHVYGHSDGGGWLCQDLMTGEVAWRERSFNKGSVAYADGYLYGYTEGNGEVALFKASPEGYEETGRFTIPEKTQLPRGSGQIWSHPVVAGGQLYLRDQDLLFCYQVGK